MSTKKSALSAACHTGPSLHLSPETRTSTSEEAKSSPDASLIVAPANGQQNVPSGSSVPDLLGAKRESIPIFCAVDKSMSLAANAPSTATTTAAASAAARARSAIPITRGCPHGFLAPGRRAALAICALMNSPSGDGSRHGTLFGGITVARRHFFLGSLPCFHPLTQVLRVRVASSVRGGPTDVAAAWTAVARHDS